MKTPRLLMRLHSAATGFIPIAEQYSRAPVCARCMAMYTALQESRERLFAFKADGSGPDVDHLHIDAYEEDDEGADVDVDEDADIDVDGDNDKDDEKTGGSGAERPEGAGGSESKSRAEAGAKTRRKKRGRRKKGRRPSLLVRQDTESLGVDLIIGTQQHRSKRALELDELLERARTHEMQTALQLAATV